MERLFERQSGGLDKGFSQIAGQQNAFVAADGAESAALGKIPL